MIRMDIEIPQQLQHQAQQHLPLSALPVHLSPISAALSKITAGFAGVTQGINDIVGGFWLMVASGVLVALVTGLGWFVYSSSTDIAEIKQQQQDMRGEMLGMHQDIRDVKNALWALSGQGLQKH